MHVYNKYILCFKVHEIRILKRNKTKPMLLLLLFLLFLFLSQTAFLPEIRNFIQFHTYKKNYIKSSVLLEKELLLYLLIELNFPFSKFLFYRNIHTNNPFLLSLCEVKKEPFSSKNFVRKIMSVVWITVLQMWCALNHILLECTPSRVT